MTIGLTGPNAAGKGEAAAYLVQKGYAYHSLSDVLREDLELRGIPPTRENLIAIGNELRTLGGPGVLAERILPRLHGTLPGQRDQHPARPDGKLAELSGRDVVDSIRNPAEVEVLRRLPGFVLIGVDAPLEVRFARAVMRGRAGDGPTLDEFRAKEARENSPDPSRQQLARTFAMADHTLSNEGSLEDLHRRVEMLLRRLEAAETLRS
jgi:dCMP deaminase